MKAAFLKQHGGPQVLEIGDLPMPRAGSGEVVVKIAYSSLNHLDLFVRKGLPNLKLNYPHILGSDASGTVESLGVGVKGVNVGDEVIVHPGVSCGKCSQCKTGIESLCSEYKILGEHVCGTNAQYLNVPDQNIFKKPKTISLQEAASLGLVFVTAFEMVVNKAAIKTGDWVLIHGAGSGVSLALIQIAKTLGAKVIATSRSEKKLETAMKLGADYSIATQKEGFLEKVKVLTERRGVDVVFDHVGQAYWESNLKALAWGGKIILCGSTSGYEVRLDLRQVFYKQIQILGSTMGSKRDFPKILEGFAQGNFHSKVDRVYPLAEIQKAHQTLENSEQSGKLLLEIG